MVFCLIILFVVVMATVRGDLGARDVEAKRCMHDGVVEAQIVPPHPPRVTVLRDLATPPLGSPYPCILPR